MAVDVVHVVQEVQFTWDAVKASANLQKHGVAFETACEIFFDPFLRASEVEIRAGEPRQLVVGMTSAWKTLVVAFTLHGESVRIISARQATPLQRRRYENQQAP